MRKVLLLEWPLQFKPNKRCPSLNIEEQNYNIQSGNGCDLASVTRNEHGSSLQQQPLPVALSFLVYLLKNGHGDGALLQWLYVSIQGTAMGDQRGCSFVKHTARVFVSGRCQIPRLG